MVWAAVDGLCHAVRLLRFRYAYTLIAVRHGAIVCVVRTSPNGRREMPSNRRRFTSSEVTELLCALDSAITAEVDLIARLKQHQLDNLVPPRERSLERLTKVRADIGRCIDLVAFFPISVVETMKAQLSGKTEDIDYGPSEATPPF